MGYKKEDGILSKRFYRQAFKFYKKRNLSSIYKEFLKEIPIALIILLPIFALLLKLFNYRHGKYVVHLVFGFYFFSFIFLIHSIKSILNYMLPVGNTGTLITWIISFIYFFIAAKQSYKRSWFGTIFTGTLVFSIYTFLILPISIAILGVISFLVF